jgi:hypothetical protein
MHPRTTLSRLLSSARRRPMARGRRPAVYLGTAAAGAVLVNMLVTTGPAASADPVSSESVSVARQLGLEGSAEPDLARELEPLSGLAASRSARDADQQAAALTQLAADQAVLDRQRAEAEAAAQRAAEEAAAAQRAAEQAAAAKAAAPSARAAAGVSGSVAARAVAKISNSAGAVTAAAQAAADAVVSNVPGAGSITIGGTRSSAADPGGHPSGKALDYMVMSDGSLGEAIVAYHVAHWDELGVEYIIWKQRMLSAPGGSWKAMENRGSATANHMDHVHVNYR